MNIDDRLVILQRKVAENVGYKVDCHYLEGYGALFVPEGRPLHPNFIVFAFPEEAINMHT